MSVVEQEHPKAIEAHRADAHRLVLNDSGAVTARCSLWWRDTPTYLDHRIGLIGHYSTSDNAAARKLLAEACAALASEGCTLAIGPMDGSPWRGYRFVTRNIDPGIPAFALEPENPANWPLQFRRNGFLPIATYTSAIADDLEHPDPRLASARKRFAESGLRLRGLDLDRFETDLRAIHSLALTAFRRNFLYLPLSEEDFLAQYLPLRDRIDPELVLLAERDGQLEGFCFSLPDSDQAARGATIDTAILKTVAVLPGSANNGLGSFLVGETHVRAHELGFRRVIHALMQDSNASLNISRRTARPMRRYAVFAKELT